MTITDLSGKVYGKWTVLGFSHVSSKRRYFWVCRCECGTERAVEASSMRSGRSKNCRRSIHDRLGPLGVRFWSKVWRTENCWLWTGRANENGYGLQGYMGKNWLSHRLAWTLMNGPIPDGLSALHRCDNSICVNPDHLFLGTAQDNMRDAFEKGRNAMGERVSSAKLTDEKALEIYRLCAEGHESATLAMQFGVTRKTIRNIIRGKTWRHVQRAVH